MKRLYYISKTMESTEGVSNDLHSAGVTDWNFHVMSKNNESGLYRRNIHSANTLHKSDIIHSAERGIFFGFFIGLALAWLLSMESLVGITINSNVSIVVVIFCVLFGGWAGGFVGIQTENYKITRFHDKLEEGYFLIMIDVVAGQEELVHQLMKKQHPEAIFCVDGSTVITPFHHPHTIEN